MQIEKNISATLNYMMEASRKTKMEFSKDLDIPRSTLQGYLKGDKCLRSDSIEMIAKSLGISPAQLISGPECIDGFGISGLDSILLEIQALHPRARPLAKEAVSLLRDAFRISDELLGFEWREFEAQEAAPENPEEPYRRQALCFPSSAAQDRWWIVKPEPLLLYFPQIPPAPLQTPLLPFPFPASIVPDVPNTDGRLP